MHRVSSQWLEIASSLRAVDRSEIALLYQIDLDAAAERSRQSTEAETTSVKPFDISLVIPLERRSLIAQLRNERFQSIDNTPYSMKNVLVWSLTRHPFCVGKINHLQYLNLR